MIIVSIVGPEMPDALRQMEVARKDADMFELRLDLLRNAPLHALLAAARRPVVATCRPEWEGGGFAGPESARIGILRHASLLGAAYVDLELRSGRHTIGQFLRRRDARVLVSWHQRSGMPFRFSAVAQGLLDSGADAVKLAYHAGDAADLRFAIEFLKEARRRRRNALAVAMGPAGEAGRILYRKFGGWATYASAAEGMEAAEGQISAGLLRSRYRAHRLDPRTRVFGLVGFPVGQSRGVAIHNPLFRGAGVDAVYCRFPVRILAPFMRHIAPHLAGFSVTLPHKEGIVRYLDGMDAAARGIGAVNTVVRRGSRLLGFNTDAPAALDAIERTTPVSGRTMLVLGAGGAARGIIWEAQRRGARVIVANRTPARARRLAREFDVEAVAWSAAATVPFGILVNATPVGMAPHTGETPFAGPIPSGSTVFDAVYNPARTRLLDLAREAGALAIPGTEMYLRQAAEQFRLYTGEPPPRERMRRLLREALAE